MKPIDYIIIGMVTILAFTLWAKNRDNAVENIKSGKWTLECHMTGGYKVIDHKKVVGREDNHWLFTNGSASNCAVIK